MLVIGTLSSFYSAQDLSPHQEWCCPQLGQHISLSSFTKSNHSFAGVPRGLPMWFSILTSSQSHKPSHCLCVTSLIFNHPGKENSLCPSQRRGLWNPPKQDCHRTLGQGEAELRGSFSLFQSLSMSAHLLISGYFLCTDLEAGCRGQGRNSCWVVKSTKPLLQASESPPDSRSCSTGWQASLQMPTQWLALLRGIFKNRLCFGLFRTIKKSVWNHRTSMFLVLLKLTKKN